MIFVFAIIFFVFGLIIGSFLNVVIYRLNTARSFGGRSACLSCQNPLSWYELIPVASFLALRGRCRNCKTKISIQYPLVEFAAGVVFTALFLKFQGIFFSSIWLFAITYAYYAFMFSILIVIAAYDFRHKIIPDSLAFIFGALAFAGLFFFDSGNLSGAPVFYLHTPALFEFLSGALVALPFAFFWLISRGVWMGLGDAKIALGLGWFLGLSAAFSVVVVAFFFGAAVGLALIIFSRNYNMKSEIPFAIYLVFGAFLAFVFGLHLFVGF